MQLAENAKHCQNCGAAVDGGQLNELGAGEPQTPAVRSHQRRPVSVPRCPRKSRTRGGRDLDPRRRRPVLGPWLLRDLPAEHQGTDRRHRCPLQAARVRRSCSLPFGHRHALRDVHWRGQGLDVRSDLGGLNLSDVPKIFIETGNMRNATDASLLASPTFRQREARALARGLATFLGS
jgi:hypothetical protein